MAKNQNDVSDFLFGCNVTNYAFLSSKTAEFISYLEASSIATATATVIPTMGLLPLAMNQDFSICRKNSTKIGYFFLLHIFFDLNSRFA